MSDQEQEPETIAVSTEEMFAESEAQEALEEQPPSIVQVAEEEHEQITTIVQDDDEEDVEEEDHEPPMMGSPEVLTEPDDLPAPPPLPPPAPPQFIRPKIEVDDDADTAPLSTLNEVCSGLPAEALLSLVGDKIFDKYSLWDLMIWKVSRMMILCDPINLAPSH